MKAKTAEWHSLSRMCRYVSWALVFYYGDADVTSHVKPEQDTLTKPAFTQHSPNTHHNHRIILNRTTKWIKNHYLQLALYMRV